MSSHTGRSTITPTIGRFRCSCMARSSDGKTLRASFYEVSNGEDTVQFAPTHYVNITDTEARKRLA